MLDRVLNTPLEVLTFTKPLREKSPYSELFWSAFPGMWTEYEEALRISPYSVRMRENADQNNSEYGRFLRSKYNLKISSQILNRLK